MDQREGRRIAIVVGCNSYDSEALRDLRYAENDAQAVWDLFVDPHVGDFSAEHSFLVLTPKARELGEKLYRGLESAGRGDSVLIYFSGHGLKDEDGRLYLAASDTDPEGGLDFSSVPGHTLRDYLNRCRSKRICLVLDCCYGGALGERSAVSSSEAEANIHTTLGGEGRAIIASAQGSQPAKELTEYGHGAFTKFMLEGLETGAPDVNADGLITPHELYTYVSRRMDEEGFRNQIPTIDLGGAGGDFQLVLSREQREEWKKQLSGRVQELMDQRRHHDALRCLDEGEAEVRGDVEKRAIQELREAVEEDLAKLADEFEERVLAEHKTLSGSVTGEILRMLEDPATLFEEHARDSRESLVRALFLGQIGAAFVASRWDIEAPGGGSEGPPGPGPEPAPDPAPAPQPGSRPEPGPQTQPADGWMAAMRRRLGQFAFGSSHLTLAGLLLLTGAAFWTFDELFFPPSFDPQNLTLGILIKQEWDTEEAAIAFGKLTDQLNVQFTEEFNDGGTPPYQFTDDAVETYETFETLESAMRSGEVDIAGELSPYLVFRMEDIAAPLMSPEFGGPTYRSVFFAAAPFMESADVMSLGDLAAYLAESDDAKLAVESQESTSGYWYPRSELLRRLPADKSFDDVIVYRSSAEAVYDAVCSGNQSVVAGAIANFRLDRLQKEGGCATELMQLSGTVGLIPQGAFVARRDLYADMQRRGLTRVQDQWRTAVDSIFRLEWKPALAAAVFGASVPFTDYAKYFPPTWEGRGEAHYEQAFDVFNLRDEVAQRESRRERVLLIIAALMLVGGALAYHRLQGVERANDQRV